MDTPTLPQFLKEGDLVVILSPASKIDKNLIAGAAQRLESWGLKVKVAPHAKGSSGHYAGSIKNRLADLQSAMDNPKVSAILCSRGGYGMVHLIDQLDFTEFFQYPKWVIGFSDITALHNTIQYHGFASLHAPMARHLAVEAEDDPCTLYLKQTLLGELPSYSCPTHKLSRKGTAEGVLRGGNLAVMYGLRGTKYDIPPAGSILFIEDIGERPHAVERMLYNLKLGGVFEQVSGVIIGQFTDFEEDKSLGKVLYGAIADLLKEYDFPVAFNFPVGHVTNNLPLINGAKVTLEVDSKEIKLSFFS